MSRDEIKAVAIKQLLKHDGQNERGGHIGAALARVSLAYDLWVDRGREASAELLIDAALDAMDVMQQAAGTGGAR
jgi:predicted ATPase